MPVSFNLPKASQGLGTVTTVLNIQGMSCGSCANHVSAALMGQAGVKTASVDLRKGSATVVHADSVQIESLVEAVVSAGYSVRSN